WLRPSYCRSFPYTTLFRSGRYELVRSGGLVILTTFLAALVAAIQPLGGAVFRRYFTAAGGADFQPAAVTGYSSSLKNSSPAKSSLSSSAWSAPPNKSCSKSFSALVTALRFSASGG